MATKAMKKPVKKPTKKTAAQSVKKSPASTPAPAPKAEPKQTAVLSFTCLTADGESVSWTQFVDAKITQDEIAAIAARKVKSGQLVKSHLTPCAPGV
jgi:transcriptional regulatory protein LevR